MHEDSELLKELNGEAEITHEDPALTKKEEKSPTDMSDEIKKAKTKKASKKLNEKLQNEGKTIRGYKITVEGEYYEHSKEIKGKKNIAKYKIDVVLPSLEGALSVIKNKLLDKMLKMKYPGYSSFRTHVITDVVPLTNDMPESNDIQYMTEKRLHDFIAFKKLPIVVENYSTLNELREAVIDCVLNPKGFEKREEARLSERKQDKELMELNNLTGGEVK